jgi:hypothetical protein
LLTTSSTNAPKWHSMRLSNWHRSEWAAMTGSARRQQPRRACFDDDHCADVHPAADQHAHARASARYPRSMSPKYRVPSDAVTALSHRAHRLPVDATCVRCCVTRCAASRSRPLRGCAKSAQQGAEGGAPRTFGIGFEERGIEELSDGHAEAQRVELSRRLRDNASTEEVGVGETLHELREHGEPFARGWITRCSGRRPVRSSRRSWSGSRPYAPVMVPTWGSREIRPDLCAALFIDEGRVQYDADTSPRRAGRSPWCEHAPPNGVATCLRYRLTIHRPSSAITRRATNTS